MIGLESRFINSPTGITLAPTASTGGSYISPPRGGGPQSSPFLQGGAQNSLQSGDFPVNWWEKLKGSIDKDFLAYAAMSMGGGQSGRGSSGGGGGGGGGGSRGGGGGMKPAGFLPPILPNIPAQAPNPGFYLNLPREQKNRYSGGF